MTFLKILKFNKRNHWNNQTISLVMFQWSDVDKEEFLSYVRFTEENNVKITKNEIFELDNYIQTQNERFRKIKINYDEYRDWIRINLDVNIGSSDLSKYSKQKKIGEGSFGKVYKLKYVAFSEII